MSFWISNAAARAAANAVTALVNTGGAGRLRLYSGTVPADADAALGSNTLLAELVMGATAFAASVDANPDALATANPITEDSVADATGAATFFRVVNGSSQTVMQGLVTDQAGAGPLKLGTT